MTKTTAEWNIRTQTQNESVGITVVLSLGTAVCTAALKQEVLAVMFSSVKHFINETCVEESLFESPDQPAGLWRWYVPRQAGCTKPYDLQAKQCSRCHFMQSLSSTPNSSERLFLTVTILFLFSDCTHRPIFPNCASTRYIVVFVVCT